MTLINFPRLHLLKLTCFIALAIAINPTQVLAQPTSPASNNLDSIKVRFIPPPASNQNNNTSGEGRGTPDPSGRQGGGTRPSDATCPVVDKRLTSLVPISQESVGGVTIEGNPTFWFYVPYTTPLTAKFVLLEKKDEDFEELYEKTFPLTGKPGVVGFTLPSTPTVKSLEIGKQYVWGFSIICNANSPSVNPVVDGEVRRVDPQVILSPSQMSQLDTATPRERIILYAAKGIWYEPLTILGDRLLQNPSDPASAADWTDLLESVGLANIAKKPVVQHYTPDN